MCNTTVLIQIEILEPNIFLSLHLLSSSNWPVSAKDDSFAPRKPIGQRQKDSFMISSFILPK